MSRPSARPVVSGLLGALLAAGGPVLVGVLVTGLFAVPTSVADQRRAAPSLPSVEPARSAPSARTPGRARAIPAHLPRTTQRTTRTTRRQMVQRVSVGWQGGRTKRKRHSTSAVVPGIGTLVLTCRPDATYVRLVAEDRTAETQLWMAKYETKNGRAVVATKTARVYRYADALDDGTGGTGASATEGLNQRGRIENFSSGYLHGVISQRPGRHQAVAGTTQPPPTSLSLTWWWTGFRHPPSWRSCSFSATLRTRLDQRMGVDWHGVDDAAGRTEATYRLPGLGSLVMRCEPDTLSDEGRQDLAIVPDQRSRRSSAYVETVTGEGLVEDHVDELTYGYDPETGRIGRIPLPRNGLLRLFVTVGGRTRVYIASSYVVANNRPRPQLNVCESAVALFPG